VNDPAAQRKDDRRREWLTPRLIAHVWWCGDDMCDCQQPLIERIDPNGRAGFPWIRRTKLWEGEFTSGAEPGTSERLERELKEAAARYGIEPGVDTPITEAHQRHPQEHPCALCGERA